MQVVHLNHQNTATNTQPITLHCVGWGWGRWYANVVVCQPGQPTVHNAEIDRQVSYLKRTLNHERLAYASKIHKTTDAIKKKNAMLSFEVVRWGWENGGVLPDDS